MNDFKAGDLVRALESIPDLLIEKHRTYRVESVCNDTQPGHSTNQFIRLAGLGSFHWIASGRFESLETKTKQATNEPLGTKQERYLDDDGEDLIDRWAARYPIEIFREIAWCQMEKYRDRLGKKDDIKKEVRKIADYAVRWLEVEEAAE